MRIGRSAFVACLSIGLVLGFGRGALGQACVGDCDSSGEVDLGEVQIAFNVFLGSAALATCQNADPDGSGEVDLGEVQRAFRQFLNGCGERVTDFVSQVFVAGFAKLGAISQGTPPPPSGAPAPAVDESATVVNGGTTEVTVQSAGGFNAVFLSVAPRTDAGSEGDVASGFFRIDLPEFVDSVTLEITTAQEVTHDRFAWRFQVTNREGQVSDVAETAVQLIQVGSGDLQVSVSWNSPGDVDLHLVEPSGEEIYFDNPQSRTGGRLDLDSNARCVDGPRQENISWGSLNAPLGTYIVRVGYFDSCGAAETDYVVTVQTARQLMTFRGTFTGDGEHGGAGAGTEITRFTL